MNEFRPTFAQYRARVLPIIGALAVVGVIDYFRLRQPLPIYLLEAGGTVIVIVIALALYFRNTRIASGPQRLEIRNAIGLSHVVDDRALASVVRVPDYQQPNRSGPTPLGRLFVLDGDGRSVLRWTTTTWTTEQMDDLTASLAIPVDVVAGRVTPREFRARYPRRSVHWRRIPWHSGWELPAPSSW